jgi:hydrogenase expression/formation protein HypD
MIDLALFRDPRAARALVSALGEAADAASRPLTFMEVCGTHTMAIHQHGIRSLLPESIRLISGPGCPVCVTPIAYVDHALALARRTDTIVATFGDLARVPGSTGSLQDEKARGADIRIVYSPLDAVALARKNPGREVVFLGVGFETTTPTIAGAILRARELGLSNFSVLSANKTMPAPMAALTADPDLAIDGYLCPAHVATVIGAEGFRSLAENYGIPCVITGFEPLDILQGLLMLTRQARAGEARVEIQYSRFVRPEGNAKAREIMARIFAPCDADWRGIGPIPGSGLRIRDEFADYDAARKLPVIVEPAREPAGCRCGEILKGKLAPRVCPLFGASCTPESPVGACMVSSEGACAAAYKYGA